MEKEWKNITVKWSSRKIDLFKKYSLLDKWLGVSDKKCIFTKSAQQFQKDTDKKDNPKWRKRSDDWNQLDKKAREKADEIDAGDRENEWKKLTG